MTTPLDLINEILVQAGYETADIGRVSVVDSFEFKAYKCAQRGVRALTISNKGWGFNETDPEVTVTLSTGTKTITLPTDANPHYLSMVMLTTSTSTKRSLTRTTYEQYERGKETEDIVSTDGEPSFWYMQNNKIYFNRDADKDYVITLKYQKLSQTWVASDSDTVDLLIDDTAYEALINMGLWRFLKIIGDSDWKEYFKLAEDPKNKGSFLRLAIAANKNAEKNALRKIKIRYNPRSFR